MKIFLFPKKLLGLLFLLCAHGIYASMPIDSILKVLDSELDNRFFYYEGKENTMERMKQQLQYADTPDIKFDLSNKLFNEYIVYQYDSAWVYAQSTLDIATALNNETLITESKLNILKSLVLAGFYKESFELINTMKPEEMPDNLKITYYQNCLRFYQDLLLYNRSNQFQKHYREKALQYCDSLLIYLNPNTFEYESYDLLRYTDDNSRIVKYAEILDKYQLSPHDYAIVYSNLAVSYHNINNIERAIYYAALSSIYDIRTSIRETTSKQSLGQWLYESGEIDFASKCMQIAMEDAIFYDNRSRKIEISAILPIIEKERLDILRSQRDKLSRYLITVSLMALIAIVLLVIIFRQISKLKNAKKSIQDQYNEIRLINSKLEETNKELERSKRMLEESNQIKDMYIVQSLYGKSEYIERFENLLKTIDRKVITRQYEDLSKLYKEFNMKTERDNMYSSFDKTFLLLFPNFIREFNKLFDPVDQVSIDEEGNLNPELRIFALIRLGITDNERIAKFLNISVKTVYSYKGKLKSKAIIPKEEFEYRISRIPKS